MSLSLGALLIHRRSHALKSASILRATLISLDTSMATSDKDEEIEEGELPEDGELEETETTIKEEKAKQNNKSSKGASESTQISVTANAQKEPSGGSAGDVQEFIKKKRAELAEKVKSQLLAGVKQRLGNDHVNDNEKKTITGSENAPPAVSTTQPSASGKTIVSRESLVKPLISAMTTSTATQSFPKKPSPHPTSKYRDLDKAQDTTETMLSSWLKRPKGSSSSSTRKKSLLESPPLESQFDDPNEEYYGTIASPPPPIESNIDGRQDQDYRLSSNTDQDYRIPPSQPSSNADVDFRRDITKRDVSEDELVGTFDESMGDSWSKPGPFVASGVAGPADGNAYGDIDERLQPLPIPRQHDRHIKRSFSDDSGSESPSDERGAKRRRRSPTSRRRGGRWGTERPPCKFFREGYCREGDLCTFSHDIEQSWKSVEKRPELCRFYMNGYCRNGRRCPYMHGEFPCKEFHKGDCSKGEECRFSHEPLNDITTPLYEQTLKDEELAAKVSVPNAKSTRKVLLGAPPPMNPQPYQEPPRMSPPMFQPPVDQYRQRYRSPSPPSSYYHPHPQQQFDQFGPPGQGPPPYYNNAHGPPPPGPMMGPGPYGSGGPVNQPLPAPDPFHPPFPSQGNKLPMDSGSSATGADNVSMHMEAMLRQIKAGMKGNEEIEESPASPEPSSEPQDIGNYRPRTIAHVVYRLIPVTVQPGKLSAANARLLLQASLTDSKLRDDPRIKNLLTSQFNAGSDEILHQITAKDPAPASSPQHQPQPQPQLPSRDPRAKRDPRLSRGQQQQGPTATPTTDRFGLQQQMQPVITDQNTVRFDTNSVSFPTDGPVALPGPQFLPNTGYNTPANNLAPQSGWMPQMNMVNSFNSTPSLGPVNVPGYFDPLLQQPQQQQPLLPLPNTVSNGQSNSSSPPQPRHHYSGPLMADSPPMSGGKALDPRVARNVSQSRQRPSSSPQTEDRDMRNEFGNEGLYDPMGRDDPHGLSPDQHENSLSLRERRKHLQYESPLG